MTRGVSERPGLCPGVYVVPEFTFAATQSRALGLNAGMTTIGFPNKSIIFFHERHEKHEFVYFVEENDKKQRVYHEIG